MPLKAIEFFLKFRIVDPLAFVRVIGASNFDLELTRKQRIDAQKDRDARLIEAKEARNCARQDVARMLEERETEAQRVRLEIETRGRAALTEAENEATALHHLGQAHRDNRAVVRYELARRRVEVGEKLVQRAPSSSAAKEANRSSPPSSSPGSSRN